MVENATHELKAKFGDRKVTGDTTETVIRACRTVGRPIFFSVLIILISFIPVFAMSGREGKLFHPMALTKRLAMVGVAMISVTVVLLRGWLWQLLGFVSLVLLALVAYRFPKIGVEFMPALNEGTVMDMPISWSRIGLAQAADDLKARDALLRGFPEVESVIGK